MAYNYLDVAMTPKQIRDITFSTLQNHSTAITNLHNRINKIEAKQAEYELMIRELGIGRVI